MVDVIRCDLCGLESKHPLTKEIDGRVLHFCCAGCWQVYELQREETSGANQGGAGTQAQNEAEPASHVLPPLQETMPTETITLSILGMTCASCVSNVRRALKTLRGVQDAVVDLEFGTAAVKYAAGQVSISDMRHAVRKAGYDSRDSDEGQQKL
jgi:copper chaperone CopZ